MLSEQQEEILRRAVQSNGAITKAPLSRPGVVIGADRLGEGEPGVVNQYLRCLEDLEKAGFVRPLGYDMFDLTSTGYGMGRYLMAEALAENKAPDTCALLVRGIVHTVMYRGASPPGSLVQVGGGTYFGVAGFFGVEGAGGKRLLAVLVGFDPLMSMKCFQGRRDPSNITEGEANLLLKRRGLRLVRLCLSDEVTPDQNGVLDSRLVPIDDPNWRDLPLGEDLVSRLDDPRAEVLADCERDVLQALLDDRKQRKPEGSTAVEIASRPTKRRFYSIRNHIRATLEDLTEKGLVQTSDGIHYAVALTRLADIDRVIGGVPSDDLYRQADASTSTTEATMSANPKKVFVVHGRSDAARKAMFDFLRALGLEPIEWAQAVRMTGEGSPYPGDILEAAFREAQAIVVMLTGDDEARLRPEHQKEGDDQNETEYTPQPRPNVLFEAGMAFGRDRRRAVLVQIGKMRRISDIEGRHVVRFDGSAKMRDELARRLETAKCEVNRGSDWLEAGDFTAVLKG